MPASEANNIKMLWFTGSSTEGLPFIHDSFRPNPKTLHIKHRHRQHATAAAGSTDGAEEAATFTARSSNHRDSVDGSEEEKIPLRLPYVVGENLNGTLNGEQASARGSNPRPDRDPVSFTSYMHRYKACARLKGISPTRAYAATRFRSNSLDDNNNNNDLEFHSPSPRRGAVDAFSATSVPMSNLRLDRQADPKSNHKHVHRSHQALDHANDHKDYKSEGSRSEHPSIPEVTKEPVEVTANGEVRPEENDIAKQIEEKLRRDGSDDDGVNRKGLNNTTSSSSGRGRKARRGDGGGGGGGQGGSSHGSGGGGGSRRRRRRGGAQWRPLGDIVSPRRMQELLTEGDNQRTLPYTYYRTTVEKENLDAVNVDPESLDYK